MKKGIIIIPFAYIEGFQSGINVQNIGKKIDLYIKNCCVSAISARKYNDNATDVAVVSNIEFPDFYSKLLEVNGVLFIKQDFDSFTFGNDYVWSLAFYKLCALSGVIQKFDYNYYSYLDSDVYVQGSFELLWKECDQNIMLYDINHGLQVRDYNHILNEFWNFLGKDILLTHYGGEFFAAKRDYALEFLKVCFSIYNQMGERNFVTTHGDEFIISLAAFELRDKIKNAGAYIFRFWTGRKFRLVSTQYISNPVIILHVPAEKMVGMIYLFDRYISKGKIPSNRKLYRILHLNKKIGFFKAVFNKLVATLKYK